MNQHKLHKKLLPLAIALISAQVCAQKAENNQEMTGQGLEEVVVEGIRAADENAREAERNKDNFSSVVTQDDAGNFSAQNVAELLQRLPGITLQKGEGEGKFVSLRGLGPGMVNVQMDGGAIANAGGGSNGDLEDRAFSLDSLPSDVLQSIEVNKSLTPDMNLDAIGGSINVRSLSALDRGRDSLKVSLQDYYSSQASSHSPKITLQGTNLFLDNTLGVAYTGSWEKRKTQGYQSKHHDTTLPVYAEAGGVRKLIPWEFTNYEENAERERITGLANIEYAPDVNSRYYVKLNHSSYADDDIALREYYRFNYDTGTDKVYLDPNSNTFGVNSVDLQQQYFIQESKVSTNTLNLGGENRFADVWQLDYNLVVSRSKDEKPDGRRVQFRLRDLSSVGSFGEEYLNGQIISGPQLDELIATGEITSGAVSNPNGYQYGEVDQPNLGYDNLFLEDSVREDAINQFSMDLRRDWTDGGFINYVKTGVKLQQRDRSNDKNRASIVPGDRAVAGCGGDLECVALAGARLGEFNVERPDNTAFDHSFITRSEAERLIAATRAIGDNYDPEEREVDSTKLDYELSEDTSAAYLMAEFQVADGATLIAGARYERTKFNSTGYMAMRNDRNEDSQGLESLDIALPLEDTGNEYSNFLPALHYRHELSEQLLARAALWTSFSRPDFGKSRAYFEITDRVQFCNTDPAYTGTPTCSDRPDDIGSAAGDLDYQAEHFVISPDNSVRIGNPKLAPMKATNLDLSLSWYGDDAFLQAALFYKDIKDFVVDANGVDVNIANDLPFTLPVDQVTMFRIPEDTTFTNARTYLNGESAKVYGAELSYTQYLDGRWEDHSVGRWLDNLFLQANLTLQNSDGDVGESVRADNIRLPETANTAANLTLGWEDDAVSVRLIGNYTGDILKRIGACTVADKQADAVLGYAQNCQDWADVYQAAALTWDFKATWKVTDGVRVYFDAINLTDNVDRYYYEGNADSGGTMLFNVEQYGRGFQMGVNLDF
ncbi:TonB-dependent receptor [Simiduia agarivorans]|uniref:Ferrienterochelin/colicin outer membrane receptor n=1 Tax=Simiduia agarivorans (strain DSM 21679 / JCM 13881 / BCRC 17597 / SA1) TaxID=1117647 RepID=K4KMC8_SIMAS|nr:TonB-dependent receptor [Simiduia agarivorans]AFU99233.1 ferrienterochelin/colicin outer membrane receptor [Simiduia agarivorans SA1 = DSM 21679]